MTRKRSAGKAENIKSPGLRLFVGVGKVSGSGSFGDACVLAICPLRACVGYKSMWRVKFHTGDAGVGCGPLHPVCLSPGLLGFQIDDDLHEPR